VTDLPEPTRERWQPLRTGLVDIFYYDAEELRFHDGRLLLRGNNGTGKSKVMALTLPFLLDGRLSPARVEPDGDSGKRMDWNLLLGEAGERQGYTWLELGRLGEHGPEYCTIGCGLKAVHGRDTRSWFFMTPQRVGESLFLVENGRTLSRDRLQQSLASSGQLFDQASAYRRGLDETLFGLGSERYEALLDLLLQLRQPQLAKRPDEKRLSDALTEALPPLDEGVIADVADAYRNLDAERQETQSLEQARDAVDAFLGHYRTYAGIATRRRARELRQAHSDYETARGNLNRYDKELTEARETRQGLAEREAELETQQRTAEQQRETLRDSPTMRSAQELGNAEDTAQERRDHAERLAAWRQRLANEHDQRRQRLDAQNSEADAADRSVRATLNALETAAGNAGLHPDHSQAVGELGLPDTVEVDATQIRDCLLDRQSRRQAGVELLQQHNRSLAQAEQEAARAREAWQRHSDEQDRLQRAHSEAQQQRAATAAEHERQWRAYLSSLSELGVDDIEGTLADLDAWTSHLEGANPAERALETARQALTAQLADQRAHLQGERQRLDTALGELNAERDELARGEAIEPPTPYTRAASQRQDRPGAPLWQLLEFRDALEPEARAGLEAAREAAGVLDAWVMPDGRLQGRDTWDTLLATDDDPAEPNLSRALTAAAAWPDAEPAVPAATVEAILQRIGYGAAATGRARVTADGGWRLGPAGGAWGKQGAVYIGHAAREAARRARLAAVDAEIGEHERARDALVHDLAALDARAEHAEQEWRQCPTDRGLRQSQAEEVAALGALNAQIERTEQARQTLAEREQTAAERRRERDNTAADLGLPTDAEALAGVRDALRDYATQVHQLSERLNSRKREVARLAELRAETEEVAAEARQAADSAREAEANARAAETRRDTLRETVGAAVAELQQQLAAVDQRLRELRDDAKALNQERVQLEQRIGHLESAITHERERVASADARRGQAIERLRVVADEGLVAIATEGEVALDAEASWAAAPAVQLARRLEQALAATDDSDTAWQRHQRGLYEHFNDLETRLGRHGQGAAIEQRDDLLVVVINFQNRRQAPDTLAAELNAEIARRRELLTARERELMENYLIDELANHLQQRLMETEQRVQRMNAELAERPTSTGMRLRMRWQPRAEGEDAGALSTPAELEATRERLLRQNMDAWSPADREAVGAFILARIDEARRFDEGGDLRRLLERALDYRYWHRFRVERWQQGRWRPAYGPASGGERALVITLPLFAAAASHYASARPEAPRLIMLDEVFAGVDDDARAKCMGLLAQFDLDVMMTSEREWGCYPEMPGLAIAQLIRREGVDAVHVSRWRWDGVRRVREADPAVAMEAQAAPDAAEPSRESLF
jgi:uncharacterized protein (TIGR02680 family)